MKKGRGEGGAGNLRHWNAIVENECATDKEDFSWMAGRMAG